MWRGLGGGCLRRLWRCRFSWVIDLHGEGDAFGRRGWGCIAYDYRDTHQHEEAGISLARRLGEGDMQKLSPAVS